MTTEEMLAALESVMVEDNDREGYYTTRELCTMMGLNKDSVLKRIAAARDAGRLDVKHFYQPDLRGYRSRHTAYRILPVA